MPGQWFAMVVALFAGSGGAALMYEIVWLQLLQLVVGSSTVSMGVLLGTYMGGLCLGSLAAPRLVRRAVAPLRLFACLELAVAAMAVLILFSMPLIGRLYAAWGGEGASGVALRGLFAGACLLPPTLAMGAALPVVARSVETTPRGVAWLGWIYAANIGGAVVGALFAGFYLLRVYDSAIATYAAASLNVIVAAGAALIDRRLPARPALPATPALPRPLALPGPSAQPARAVYAAIALSGFCALAGEVVWTRLLALQFGATVYTFSIVLAVFLVGLGIGGAAGSLLVGRVRRHDITFGVCQWLAALGTAWSGLVLAAVLPYWPAAISPADIWATFRLDISRSLVALLPPALLWGASFPLALAAAASRRRRLTGEAEADGSARIVAGVYAANTVGAIAGALGTSLLLVGRIGSQRTEWVMIAMSAAAGALVIGRDPAGRLQSAALRIVGAAAVTIACATLVPPLPGVLVAYGRHAANWTSRAGDIIYVAEGANSSIAVSRTPDGVLNYHNAGKIQASSEPQDMRLQRMLGHLTTLVPTSARSVLVIGCGAGVTAGAVAMDPQVEQVTIAEIEPLVPRVAAEYFGSVNADVIRSPKVRLRIDDARHFLLTTKETFDAITSDPLDPWVKGAATLYTREFFELAKAHLKPGGVMTLFVQLYESSPDTVRSEIATFFDAFPNGTIWGNTYQGVTGDTVLLGQTDPTVVDVDALEWRLNRPEYEPVRRSLGEVGFFSAIELVGSYGGRAQDLAAWLRDAPRTTDRNLRLEYLAGLGLNLHVGDRIYADLLRYRRFPADMFAGTPSSLAWLREQIEGPRE